MLANAGSLCAEPGVGPLLRGIQEDQQAAISGTVDKVVKFVEEDVFAQFFPRMT